MTSSETVTKENTIVQEEEEEEEEDEEMEKKMKSEEKKKKSPAGVIYLSRIPTKMNVKLIREYFSSFGDVDRIYLEPEGNLSQNFLNYILHILSLTLSDFLLLFCF